MENTNGTLMTLEDQQTAPDVRIDSAVAPGFATKDAFELAMRQAKWLAGSTLVPAAYQNNVGNCLIALDMCYRIGANPLLVMQNLHVIQNKPSFSAQFLIATFNKCGRFSPIRYEWSADKSECRAWAIEKATGQRVEGAKISLAMAKAEGWSEKSGSKWKTMPELMLQYRAAAFLVRTIAPEMAMGLHTSEEVEDIVSTGDELASGGQVGMIQSLLITAEIGENEKDRIESELDNMSGSATIKCITYLKDKQPSDHMQNLSEQARK